MIFENYYKNGEIMTDEFGYDEFDSFGDEVNYGTFVPEW